MTVFKRSDLLDAAELFLQGFVLFEDFGSGVAFGFRLGGGEALEFVVDGVCFCERVEQAG